MQRKLQKIITHETLFAILLIFFTTLITYGVSIPKLGYYYDDWYLLWSGNSRGAESLITLFSTDRPFMGVVTSITYSFLGDKIINWHLYALLWRFIGGAAFFWITRLTWPDKKYISTIMSVLFIVYPGFLSQPDAATKQNHLYGFGSALLSIALMLQGLKASKPVWKYFFNLSAFALTLNYLFIYEYMIGLEGMRLILLGYNISQTRVEETRPFISKLLKHWWPYPIASAVFLSWRLFFFEGARNATNPTRLFSSYLSNIPHMLTRLLFETVKDFLDTSVFAWSIKPHMLFSNTTYTNMGWAILTAGFVIILVMVYSFMDKRWWGNNSNINNMPKFRRDIIWIGAFSILFAIFPVILSERQLDLTDAYKSYGLHPIGGVILFVTGIILMLQPDFRSVFMIILIGISVSTQVLNADEWAQLWDYQRNMWWQLSWRAPDIRDDTTIIAYLPEGYRLQQDYEIWGPVNLIYRDQIAESPAISAEVLNNDTVDDIFKNNTRNNPVRDIKIHRDYNNLLLITVPSRTSCMHIIDGSLPVYSAYEALLVQQIGTYSRVDRIIPSEPTQVHTPRSEIFGPEPAREWCYYYQRASLARQTGNWKEIGRLYDHVLTSGLEPEDKSEIIPFFEGLVNTGRYDEARKIYNEEIKGQQEVRYPLCASLNENPDYPPEFNYNYEEIFDILCNS